MNCPYGNFHQMSNIVFLPTQITTFLNPENPKILDILILTISVYLRSYTVNPQILDILILTKKAG